jgi:hypothetical protein
MFVAYTYGAAAGGGVDSNVYIVRKGAPVRIKTGSEVFGADLNDRWAIGPERRTSPRNPLRHSKHQ